MNSRIVNSIYLCKFDYQTKQQMKRAIKFPYHTEVLMNGFGNGEIVILSETEKAFLMSCAKKVRRGTSKMIDRNEFTFWCPKTVWFNDSNFENAGHSYIESKGAVVFNPPHFLNIK